MKLKRFLSLLLTLCMMMSITQFPISAEEPSFSASGSVSMYVDSLHAYVTSSGVDSDGYTTYEVELPTNPTFDSNEYYANQLSGYQKQLYRAFMDGFCDIADNSLKLKQKVDVYYTTSVSVNVSSQEELEEFLYEKLDEEFEKIDGQTLYNAIQYDHTELFWMHGVSLNIAAGVDYKNGVATIYWVVEMLVDASNLYSSNASLISAAKSMTTAVNNIVAAAPTTGDYDTLVYFNEWLKENNTYNHTHLENGNYPLAHAAISALTSKNSETKGPVCQGYAYAFKYLCDKVGIDCVVVSGDLYQTYADPGPHAWNAVKLDGKWYGVDVTSTDSLDTDEYDFLVGSETKSFDPTYTTFSTCHVIDNTHTYPTLSKTAYQPAVPVDFTYTIANNEVTITGYTGSKTSVMIPSTIEGYPVKHIADNVFSMNNVIRTVYIAESVETIGEQAFAFTHIAEINIPKNVKTIGKQAFAFNLDLVNITVDGDNSYFASVDGVLFNKAKTKLILYPIGRSDVTEYVVPNGVTTIDSYAFDFETNLVKITLPNTLTVINDSAFEHVVITDVYYIGTKADKNGISIGAKNTYLTDATWHYFDAECDSTCSDCSETRVAGNHTYDNGCDSDCNVCGATRTPVHAYDNDCDPTCNRCGATRNTSHIYDNDCDTSCNRCGATRTTSHVYDNDCDPSCNNCGDTRVTSHTYDDENDEECNSCGHERGSETPVTSFEYTIKNGKVTITRYIGTDIEVVVPKIIAGYPVTEIGTSAFSENSSLKLVVLPDGIETIGSYAFFRCYAITKIVIPDSVKTINVYAFNSCESLKTVDLGKGVKSIGGNAFSGCIALESITFPSSLKTVESYAFMRCFSLQTLVIPATLTNLDNSAFIHCTGLKTVVIESQLTTILANTFYNCNQLTTITLPASVTAVEDGAFNGCTSLANVYFTGTKADKESISFGNWNTYITDATWHYVLCEKNGHTYDNDQDDTCNICEEKRVIVIIVPGDVNGDGVVNNKDLGVLRRYLNDWDVEIDEEASDVNDDGFVNNKDLGILRRYLNDWDVVLK